MLYKKLKSPTVIQIEITTKCNNQCIYCYNYWRENNIFKHFYLTKENIQKIIKELYKNEVFRITITGGEPLLYFENTLYLIKLAKKYGIHCNLNSNLTTANEILLKELKKAGLTSILASIPSCYEEHYEIITGSKNFKNAVQGIKLAKKIGFYISVNMVVCQINKNDVYETAEFAKKLGIKSFNATKASPVLNDKKDSSLQLNNKEIIKTLDDLIKIKEILNLEVGILECYPLCLIQDCIRYKDFIKNSCSAGITTFTIGADCNIRPCSHADIIYGNILKENLPVIWENMKEWRTGELLPEECLKCNFFKQCSGGCRMESKYTGSIKNMDPHALGSKTQIKLLLPKNQSSEKITDLENNIFYVNPFIKIREELFGGVIYIKNNSILITKDSIEFLKILQNKKYFTVNEINKEFNISPKINLFLSELLNKNFLLKKI